MEYWWYKNIYIVRVIILQNKYQDLWKNYYQKSFHMNLFKKNVVRTYLFQRLQ